MPTVYDRLGRTLRTGKNLAVVLRHASYATVNVVKVEGEKPNYGYPVTFYFDDGATCTTHWADWRVLLDWIKARRSWSVERLTFDTALEAVVMKEWQSPRLTRLRASGTIVTLHKYFKLD